MNLGIAQQEWNENSCLLYLPVMVDTGCSEITLFSLLPCGWEYNKNCWLMLWLLHETVCWHHHSSLMHQRACECSDCYNKSLTLKCVRMEERAQAQLKSITFNSHLTCVSYWLQQNRLCDLLPLCIVVCY